MLADIKTTTITEKGQIVIPKSLRNIKGFEEGSKVVLVSYADRIEVRPLSAVRERMETAYASEKALAKDWDSKEEDDAWKSL